MWRGTHFKSLEVEVECENIRWLKELEPSGRYVYTNPVLPSLSRLFKGLGRWY
jgi:hypothetical protein